ncbi:hypothetical protein CYLTODRAFT_448543 [Cylindrobasidium torrendii FP15055 ss-10]|uniref:Uncharacterized protein n=1 Tax=Cylindrobasidium torrendii FP15055 ss-10 TaxID=1314674 RepID=A0A0D7BUT2_9AGAR|nr:hypothetical protein CYLTODRAFT_448543 [Cylindrobasidium torrendii FP15055 ss-10]
MKDKRAKQSKPQFTPMYKLLHRRRQSSASVDARFDKPTVSAPPPAPLDSPRCKDHPQPRGQIAILNEDPTEDAVIVTTFDVVPFCCHKDLLALDRTELVRAALQLNARLPAILSIDIERNNKFITDSIEVLVGIRSGDIFKTPEKRPTLAEEAPCIHSSLSARGTPKLHRLAEEDSDVDQLGTKRLLVRSATVHDSPSPRRQRHRISSLPLSPLATSKERIYHDLHSPARPRPRALVARTASPRLQYHSGPYDLDPEGYPASPTPLPRRRSTKPTSDLLLNSSHLERSRLQRIAELGE